nr:uncharacterized protein LOC128671492 [Plodia interpunctella]
MLLFAFIIALGAVSVRSDECLTVASGTILPGSRLVPVADVVVGPGYVDWKITYPLPQCDSPVLEVTVCDEVLSQVQFASDVGVIIVYLHRTGSVSTSVVVHGKYWCSPYSGGLTKFRADSAVQPLATALA